MIIDAPLVLLLLILSVQCKRVAQKSCQVQQPVGQTILSKSVRQETFQLHLDHKGDIELPPEDKEPSGAVSEAVTS